MQPPCSGVAKNASISFDHSAYALRNTNDSLAVLQHPAHAPAPARNATPAAQRNPAQRRAHTHVAAHTRPKALGAANAPNAPKVTQQRPHAQAQRRPQQTAGQEQPTARPPMPRQPRGNHAKRNRAPTQQRQRTPTKYKRPKTERQSHGTFRNSNFTSPTPVSGLVSSSMQAPTPLGGRNALRPKRRAPRDAKVQWNTSWFGCKLKLASHSDRFGSSSEPRAFSLRITGIELQPSAVSDATGRDCV